jgi:very-short-patch-repair endonuclease
VRTFDKAPDIAPEVLRQPIKAVKRARALRKEMSLPEVLLWVQLKQRPSGYLFRKQVPMHPYTLDFACMNVRLAIEVDGEAHSRGDQPKKDEVRDRWMAERGFATLRLPAYEVLKNMDGCIAGIVAACAERGPPNPPRNSSPERGGRPRSGGGVPSSGQGSAGEGLGPLRRFAPPPRAGEDFA